MEKSIGIGNKKVKVRESVVEIEYQQQP